MFKKNTAIIEKSTDQTKKAAGGPRQPNQRSHTAKCTIITSVHSLQSVWHTLWALILCYSSIFFCLFFSIGLRPRQVTFKFPSVRTKKHGTHFSHSHWKMQYFKTVTTLKCVLITFFWCEIYIYFQNICTVNVCDLLTASFRKDFPGLARIMLQYCIFCCRSSPIE